jgi:hypothetical protein
MPHPSNPPSVDHSNNNMVCGEECKSWSSSLGCFLHPPVTHPPPPPGPNIPLSTLFSKHAQATYCPTEWQSKFYSRLTLVFFTSEFNTVINSCCCSKAVLSSSSRPILGSYLTLGHNWFLPHPFQFIIHWSSHHLTLTVYRWHLLTALLNKHTQNLPFIPPKETFIVNFL